MVNNLRITAIVLFLFLLHSFCFEASAQTCTSDVPNFSVDFTGNPGGSFTTNTVSRAGTCCINSTNCVHFDITIDANTIGINFLVNGAPANGSLFYQLDCGAQTPVGTVVCVSGAGHHDLTFCKPGGNDYSFVVQSVSGPVFPADQTVKVGCTVNLPVSGLVQSSLTWTSVYPGAQGDYNSRLSCTSNCLNPVFTPQDGDPAYIDYQVCGNVAASACVENPLFCHTVRVYIIPKAAVSVLPLQSTLSCKVTSVTLTATATPGATFSWSPGGATTSSITVSSTGTYTCTATTTDYNCVSTASASSTVSLNNALPNLSCGLGDKLTCTHTSGQICASADGESNFKWSGPGIVGADDNGCITVNKAGTYTVVATNPSSGCTQSCSILVTADKSTPAPVTIQQSNVLTCLVSSTQVCVTAVGGVTYSWSGPAISGSNIGNCITVTNGGTYTVVATKTETGCTLSTPYSVQKDISTPSIGTPQQSAAISCVVSSATVCLPAVAGVTYLWSGPAVSGTNVGNCITVTDGGTYTVTATKASNGCTRSATFSVQKDISTPNLKCGDDGLMFCNRTTASLCVSAASGTTFVWSGPHIIGSNTGSCITSDSVGTYTVVATKTSSGCTATCSVQNKRPSVPTICKEYCTLTQGFYGSTNGKICDGRTSPQLINDLLAKGPMVLGDGARTITFMVSDAFCLNSKMPSGSTPGLLPLGNVFCFNASTSQYLKNGKFINILLGQTITLGLNVRMDTALGRVAMTGQYMLTYRANKCVNGIPVGAGSWHHIPQSVLTYLGANNTINDLIVLANKTLGGTAVGGPSFSAVNEAVDAINEGFDECRFLILFSNTPSIPTIADPDASSYKISQPSESNSFSENTVKVYPNPFFDKTTVEVTSVSDHSNISIELFSLDGASVYHSNSGAVKANETYQLEINGANLPKGIYLYRIIAGDEVYHGKVVLMKD